MTLGALADTEDERGHGDAAIHMGRDASPPLCHLTAALICLVTGVEGAEHSIYGAAVDLRELGTDAAPPVDVADLCRQLSDVPGTDLAGLLARLVPDEETLARAYQQLVAAVRDQASRLTE